MELLWVGAAFLAGLITSRLYLPPLVGYLMAGYILNAAGVEANDTLKYSDEGFFTVMPKAPHYERSCP